MHVAFILPAIRCETDCMLDADCCTIGVGVGGMVDTIVVGGMIDVDDCGCV